jgi:hypothetical protein
MAGVMAQVVEHLPSKCQALSSNLSTVKETERERDGVGGVAQVFKSACLASLTP